MKLRITTLCLLLFATASLAEPLIRVDFFDADKSPVGPATQLRIGEIGTAHVVVSGAEMMLGGASFRLSEPYAAVQPLNMTYPPGVVIGNLWDGVEIGLAEPIPVFGDGEAIIASFDFLALDLTITEIWPMPLPGETAPLIADATGVIAEAAALPGTIFVELRPTIGLYFDEAGTVQDGTFIGGDDEFRDVYMLIRDLDRPIDACYFALSLPPSMEVVETELPEGATLTGDVMTAASIAFSPQLEAPGFTPVLMARFRVRLGGEYLFGAELKAVGYDMGGYGTPAVVIVPAWAFQSISLPAYVTLPIAAERKSMSELKSLYR